MNSSDFKRIRSAACSVFHHLQRPSGMDCPPTLHALRVILPAIICLLIPFVAMAGEASNAPAALAEARELHAEGSNRRAVVRYEDVLNTLSLREHWPSARFELASLYHQQADWRRAVKHWEKLAADHPNAELAPKALWMLVATRSGPMNNKRAAIRTAELLARTHPHDPYGERASYAQALLHFWNRDRARTRNAVNTYLREYRDGRFDHAARRLLEEVN